MEMILPEFFLFFLFVLICAWVTDSEQFQTPLLQIKILLDVLRHRCAQLCLIITLYVVSTAQENILELFLHLCLQMHEICYFFPQILCFTNLLTDQLTNDQLNDH